MPCRVAAAARRRAAMDNACGRLASWRRLGTSTRSFGAAFLRWALRLLLLPLVAWAAAALWFDGPSSHALAGTLAALFAATALAMLIVPRRLLRGLLLFAALFLVVLLWWLSIPPSNERHWMADVAELPYGQVDGDTLTIHNVRDCRYVTETDYEARWDTRTYDLSGIDGLDLFLCYWGPREIAHTILSWDFADGQHLAISIETRKEVGEEYSAVRGFFRQYELYYVVADERDVIRLRTDYRGEDVYLYRLRTPPDRARQLLLQYVEKLNGLVTQPAWYNALTHNCTTVIFDNVRPIVGRVPFDWRILLNGRIDQMLYEQGVINTSLPFETLRERSHVNEMARRAGQDADFSGMIRSGIPGRPPPPAR